MLERFTPCDHIKTEPQHVAIRGAIGKQGRHVFTEAVRDTLNIQAIQLMLTCLSIHLINLGEHSDMSKLYMLILVNFFDQPCNYHIIKNPT
jgi:hypothetical protein